MYGNFLRVLLDNFIEHYLLFIFILIWRKNLLSCHTQSVIIFYSYEFDEDDFEEEIMPIPKKRAALKNVQDEKTEEVKPEAKKAKSEAKKAAPLKNVQEKEETEKEVVKPEAAKPPAKKKGRKK